MLLFQNAPLAIAQCNSAGVITAANRAFEQLLGIDAGSATGVPLRDLVPGQHGDEIDSLLGEVSAGRRESFQFENQIEPKAPRTPANATWVRWTVWRVASSEGGAVGKVAMAEDTTAHHASDRRLRQSGRLEALGRLASGVAHDFNNLLTGVILYSDLLLAGLEAEEMQTKAGNERGARQCGDRLRKYAEEIRTAGVHATGLVQQLLALARAPNEAPHLLSLNAVAEGMRQLLLRLIGENIELVYKFDPSLGAVRMDFTHAQQILLNLVLNARDAMPEGGRITLETRNCRLQIVSGGLVEKTGPVELPCALFAVSDNGQGMDSETQQHCFEAFFSTKNPGEGTGLGLSTVCDIVTNNGGLIHVDSEKKKGTRVTVLLPLIPQPSTSLPLISPAELPKVFPGDSKPQSHEGALPISQEEPTP